VAVQILNEMFTKYSQQLNRRVTHNKRLNVGLFSKQNCGITDVDELPVDV
jgi:hypothetical protein